MEGLEPPRLSAPDPKSGTATNYATYAKTMQKQPHYNKDNIIIFADAPLVKDAGKDKILIQKQNI